MPVYLFWGEDNFCLGKAIQTLRDTVIDPNWESFNYQRLGADGAIEALNQAVTPPFGLGGRLIWIEEAPIFNKSSESTESQMAEFERTLPRIPENNHLLFTQTTKPDERLKSTKILRKLGEVREFALIAPWQEDQLRDQVLRMAGEQKIKVTPGAAQLLAEAIGNDTRRLDGELTKLALYVGDRPVDEKAVAALTISGAQSSFNLGSALLAGNTAQALNIVDELLRRNEPALRMLAVLVNQFRTWLWVRVMVESGERDRQVIAKAADVGNPNRLFFLQKETQMRTARQLSRVLPALLEAEVQLKTGQPDCLVLQTLAVRIGTIFN
jgi:DNA polymerase III subunit delta